MALLQSDGQLFSRPVAALWHFFKLAGNFFKLTGTNSHNVLKFFSVLHCGRKTWKQS
jgi:hypothetical protein